MSSNNSNKKSFWNYVKSKQDHSGISILISTTNTTASESSEKAEAQITMAASH